MLGSFSILPAGKDREQSGRCISSLAYAEGSCQTTWRTDSETHWSYTFQSCERSLARNLQELGFGNGDLVVLSIEGKTLETFASSLVD